MNFEIIGRWLNKNNIGNSKKKVKILRRGICTIIFLNSASCEILVPINF